MATEMQNSDAEQQENVKKKSLYEYFVAIALGLMAIGQWGDTKDIAVEAWQLTLSNFTHKYEYESLNHVNVGSNLDYISTHFGKPKLIKKSKYHENLNFAYYLEKKFILTLILEGDRVNAYTITGLVDDFIPYGLLDKQEKENTLSIADNYTKFQDFTLDFNNVEFLLVKEELGKEKLFVNQYVGAIGYEQNINASKAEFRGLYEKLNMDDEAPNLLADVKRLTKKVRNNFYGVGEVSLSVVADSVLTDFEYSLYYKK
ncbi:ETEC_3214 domain-containing protein [Pseudoalteromonas sp. MMG007]|uniref:ETEC_3214 domain-containing protein n=1 Tax=Pseudoalteromonas sp. MMG007 TaxID=2822684 RepID=UPI001B360272|nr:ETEC_3214 domain-containing protein [Pseudoalteromonas sp. MMG007]MBQ4857749.1 hypothetical protein [Pseudoalteromonas sp. MMG007]